MKSIRVNLNDDWVEIPEQGLSDALAAWHYGDRKVAVAINGEFVPRSAYAETELREGDRVEVVAPVGGG